MIGHLITGGCLPVIMQYAHCAIRHCLPHSGGRNYWVAYLIYVGHIR
jgi:hypothetical protein